MLAESSVTAGVENDLPSDNGNLASECELLESWSEVLEGLCLQWHGHLDLVGAWWVHRAATASLVLNGGLSALSLAVGDDWDLGVALLGGGHECCTSHCRCEGLWACHSTAGSAESGAAEHAGGDVSGV